MVIKDRIDNTSTMKFTDARAHLSEIFNRVAKEDARIIVEKNGVPVGAIVSLRELERVEEVNRQIREDALSALRVYSEAFKDVPEDELQREIDKAVSEVRAEMREERERMQRT